jgi:hypothetical protein
LRAENAINSLEPVFVDPASNDFTPLGDWLDGYNGYAIPDFTWELADIPAGSSGNTIEIDAIGQERNAAKPGAIRP